MGVIKKQSIQSAILTYIGVFIGFVNAVIILPKFFDVKEVGLLSFLNSLSSILSTFFTLGVPLITIKMFPYLRSEEKKHNGFFGFTLIMSALGIALGAVFYLLFENRLISGKNEAYSYTLFPLLLLIVFAARVLYKNFDAYARMLFKTVLGTFLDNVLTKTLIFLILIAAVIFGIQFEWTLVLYAASLSLAGIIILIYSTSYPKSFSLGDFKKAVGSRKKELYSLGLFGIIGSAGSIIVMEVDAVMVSNHLGLEIGRAHV